MRRRRNEAAPSGAAERPAQGGVGAPAEPLVSARPNQGTDAEPTRAGLNLRPSSVTLSPVPEGQVYAPRVNPSGRSRLPARRAGRMDRGVLTPRSRPVPGTAGLFKDRLPAAPKTGGSYLPDMILCLSPVRAQSRPRRPRGGPEDRWIRIRLDSGQTDQNHTDTPTARPWRPAPTI